MTVIVGIDLGTTYSAVACVRDGHPQLIPNSLGEVLTPSVVGFEDDGRLLVGQVAKEYSVLHPDRCAAMFKRQMGTDWTFSVDGQRHTPVELSSLVLKSLKQDAELWLSTSVARAVISVPAYFNDDQRKATILAGQMAGLHVERIINEPTAAAIAYGLHEAGNDKLIAVFDLGGGTFDVSLVDLFEGLVEVRASSGVSQLGGEDFTRALAARVLAARGLAYEHAEIHSPLLVARLIEHCERAKRQLSREASVDIPIPDEQGKRQAVEPTVTVTRAEFQQWTRSILTRIDLPLRRCLGDAKVPPEMVEEVILVGGATRMPAVSEHVTRFFRQLPRCRLNPDEVVALGAAVQAGLIANDAHLEDLVVTDVAPFTLGVEVSKKVGMERRPGYFSPIIHRNTTIPVSRAARYSTVEANQTEIRLKVYQGESRRVSENLLLGELEIGEIPRGPAGQEVEVRLTYDLNGVLEVEATVVATGQKVSTVIARHAQSLCEAEIAAAVEKMQALKTHPREVSANHFLLRRAEKLYGELPLEVRDELASLLDGFEQVLEMQDGPAISRFRERLETLLQRFEGDRQNDCP